MTRTPDEIKKGLECCMDHDGTCEDCPYVDGECRAFEQLSADALALIQQLQAENAEQAERIKQLEVDRQQLEGMLTHMNQLRDAAAGRALKMEERVHQLEAERDAAVEEAHGHCSSCKDYDKDPKEEPCASCFCGYVSPYSKLEGVGFRAENDYELLDGVTHWMPLPNPPEEPA